MERMEGQVQHEVRERDDGQTVNEKSNDANDE